MFNVTDPQSALRRQKLDETIRQVTNYQNKQRVEHDVWEVLKHCSTLQPQYQSFSAAGRTQSLFFLSGTLPCVIQGNTYNIPVTIYFDPPYPAQAPRCFVTPAEGMAVNPQHPNVGNGGLIQSLPSLHSWSQYNSSLPRLIAEMTNAFSQRSPVYAVTGGSGQSSQQQQGYATQHGVAMATAKATPVVKATAVAHATPTVQATAVAHATPTPAPMPQRDHRQEAINELTEKARNRWPVVMKEIVDDINDQQQKKYKLENHSNMVASEIKSMKEKIASNTENTKELEASEKELQDFVNTHAGKEPNPDDLEEQLDSESKEVLHFLSEELAISDYLDALDMLLEAKKISMDVYLSQVRDSSREQFKVKYQKQKAVKAVKAAAGAQSPTGRTQAAVAARQPVRQAVAA